MTDLFSYRTIVADPPWRFQNRTGKGSPEHGRLHRYDTMALESICALGPQVLQFAEKDAHLYLWVPTALMRWGLQAVAAWGFTFKTALYWHKVTMAGQSDRSCMGFYYRNVVEPCLFAVRGSARTNEWNVPNLFAARKGRHSEKPAAFYDLVERQSQPRFLELFARQARPGWDAWGNEVNGPVVIVTDEAALATWREVVADVLERIGRARLQDIYSVAEGSEKVRRAKTHGHRWQAQIRRTLQGHFNPAGHGVWEAA
jgi:N6-adenosine-specific RNA methylase IME4